MNAPATVSERTFDALEALQLAEARFVEAGNRRLRAARVVIEASAGCDREIRDLRSDTEFAQRAEQDFLVSARNLAAVWRQDKTARERAAGASP